MIDKLNRIFLASLILWVSLFLSIMWKLWVGDDATHTFIFLDISNGLENSFFSWSPIEPRKNPQYVIIPFHVSAAMGWIYIACFLIAGKMKHPTFGSIWIYYGIYEILKFADWYLALWHTPFRYGAILGIMIIPAIYLEWTYREYQK